MKGSNAGPVLVDSSLWIEYYRPDGRPQRREAVRELLLHDRVATTAMILIEVLQGATTPQDYDALRDDFRALHWLGATRAACEEAARGGSELRGRGQAVPATDLSIAAVALEHGCELWHLDAHFERIAGILHIRQVRLT